MSRTDAMLLTLALGLGVLNFVESLIARWRDQQLAKRIEKLERDNRV